MQIQDARWDDYYKYIWYQETAGELSTRFTAWYTAGLLARKQGNDVDNAKAALENMYVVTMLSLWLWINTRSKYAKWLIQVFSLSAQMSAEYESAWYGTWKVTLDTPVPTDNSSYWPPEIYVSILESSEDTRLPILMNTTRRLTILIGESSLGKTL